jgi:hypothetical protein
MDSKNSLIITSYILTLGVIDIREVDPTVDNTGRGDRCKRAVKVQSDIAILSYWVRKGQVQMICSIIVTVI